MVHNIFLSDIQASLIAKTEYRIETYQQLIDSKEVGILANTGSYTYKLLQKVNYIYEL